LVGVLVDRLRLGGGPWDILTGIDLNSVGYILVGTFAITWGIAVAVWRLGHLEERWSVSVTDRRDDGWSRHPPLSFDYVLSRAASSLSWYNCAGRVRHTEEVSCTSKLSRRSRTADRPK
jgi:hypothetical protein